MKVQKWDFINHVYEPYDIPDHYHTPLYTNDMEEIVNCAGCGTRIKYGQCYTSMTIHNNAGLGYPVCYKCYLKELRIRTRGEQYDK